MPRSTVLVVEDDEAIRRGVVDSLRFAGYDVLESASGTKGLQLALESSLDLVLLDVLLPGVDGFSILGQIREAHPTLPVILVTARGAEEDRVRGLSNGADDYVVKPFSARELLARVEAVLRRSPERPDSIRTLMMDDAQVDLEKREIINGSGARQSLSEREAAILRYLAGTRGRAVDRRELLQRVWGLNPRGIETRTVDMHIARLRDKLGDDPADARFILTVRGKGYRLADAVRTGAP